MIVRKIEDPSVVVTFGGYTDETGRRCDIRTGHFVACYRDGGDIVEPVADWEPIDGHGGTLEWPGHNGSAPRHKHVIPNPDEVGVIRFGTSGEHKVSYRVTRDGITTEVVAVDQDAAEAERQVKHEWNRYWERNHDSAA